MRRLQIVLAAIAMALTFCGSAALAKQKKSAPAAAATPGEAAPKAGGCMPDGSCCGSCAAAQHDGQGKNAAAPAEAADCPCKHMKKQTN